MRFPVGLNGAGASDPRAYPRLGCCVIGASRLRQNARHDGERCARRAVGALDAGLIIVAKSEPALAAVLQREHHRLARGAIPPPRELRACEVGADGLPINGSAFVPHLPANGACGATSFTTSRPAEGRAISPDRSLRKGCRSARAAGTRIRAPAASTRGMLKPRSARAPGADVMHDRASQAGDGSTGTESPPRMFALSALPRGAASRTGEALRRQLGREYSIQKCVQVSQSVTDSPHHRKKKLDEPDCSRSAGLIPVRRFLRLRAGRRDEHPSR